MSAAISLTSGRRPGRIQVSPAIGLLLMAGYVVLVLVAGAFMSVTGCVTGAWAKDGEVRFHLRLGGRQRTVTVPATGVEQGRGIAWTILVAPFQRRAWSELAFFLISGPVGALGAVLIVGPMGFGVVLALVFIGMILIAAGLRGVRGLGSWHRAVARHFLNERIPDPDPLVPHPGLFGWLGSAFRDRASWRGPTTVTVDLPGHA